MKSLCFDIMFAAALSQGRAQEAASAACLPLNSSRLAVGRRTNKELGATLYGLYRRWTSSNSSNELCMSYCTIDVVGFKFIHSALLQRTVSASKLNPDRLQPPSSQKRATPVPPERHAIITSRYSHACKGVRRPDSMPTLWCDRHP